MSYSIDFPSGTVNYYFDKEFNDLEELAGNRKTILITDENLFDIYPDLFGRFETVVVPPGEKNKTLDSLHLITGKLLELEADRHSLLVGVGGGMITDLTGFAASIYMRGVSFGFVPTTLLGMVDASIGGKNGINFGLHKNMLGTFSQPEFILFDQQFLKTLPEKEWSNGFAEIIKYAFVFDWEMVEELSDFNVGFFRKEELQLKALIQKCVGFKNKVVLEDENEKGVRKLLNFGHTVGHAIETLNEVPHGYAVALGMIVACEVSGIDANYLRRILDGYGLPTRLSVNVNDVMEVLKMDKKRYQGAIDFIVLESHGAAKIESTSFEKIEAAIKRVNDAGND